MAILEGHHAAVIDLKINERQAQCYTFSKDAVRIFLWIILFSKISMIQ
jgi:hypothetical protein